MAENGWHKVDPADVPDDGRVRSVVLDGRTVALSRCGARLGALESCCPHQGGPLGEGAIEKGWLRCPWHGYDYDPLTGRPPAGFSDGASAYPVWHTSLHNPDWARYAQLCGATGIQVISRDQLDEAMNALFASDGPALLCVEQDAELL